MPDPRTANLRTYTEYNQQQTSEKEGRAATTWVAKNTTLKVSSDVIKHIHNKPSKELERKKKEQHIETKERKLTLSESERHKD